MMDVTQILQSLSHKVWSNTPPDFIVFALFILLFELSNIIHQQLVAMSPGRTRFVYTQISSHANELVRQPNSENWLDLIFTAPPREKAITVPDTNYIKSANRKFMLDMPSPGSFQNIGLLI